MLELPGLTGAFKNTLFFNFETTKSGHEKHKHSCHKLRGNVGEFQGAQTQRGELREATRLYSSVQQIRSWFTSGVPQIAPMDSGSTEAFEISNNLIPLSNCIISLAKEYHFSNIWIKKNDSPRNPLAFAARDAYAMWVWDLQFTASGLSKYCSHSRHCCEWWRKEMSVIRVTSPFPIAEAGSKSVAGR